MTRPSAAAGGNTDISARAIGAGLSPVYGQQAAADNLDQYARMVKASGMKPQ